VTIWRCLCFHQTDGIAIRTSSTKRIESQDENLKLYRHQRDNIREQQQYLMARDTRGSPGPVEQKWEKIKRVHKICTGSNLKKADSFSFQPPSWIHSVLSIRSCWNRPSRNRRPNSKSWSHFWNYLGDSRKGTRFFSEFFGKVRRGVNNTQRVSWILCSVSKVLPVR
jgi:hypothetical protein